MEKRNRILARMLVRTALGCLPLLMAAVCFAEDQTSNPSLPLTQGGGAIPLPVRPFTWLENLQNKYSYIPQLETKIPQARMEAQRKLTDVLGNRTPSYDRGADVGEIVANVMHDFQTIIGDFFDCLDFKIVGLCYKISWHGISFDIYRQYRLPVQDVESVQTPGKSGFLPKFVNNPMMDIVESTYYPLAADIATTSMQWTQASASLTASLAGYELPEPLGDLEGDDSIADKVKQIPKQKRFRNLDDTLGGSRYAEYTVLPQIFNQIMGRLWFFCHDVLFPGIWSSYYPATIMPARMSVISFFLFPAEMMNKFLVPNTCSGVNNQLRGGKAPFDLTLTQNMAYDAMNLVSPGMGCLKENDGGWVPVSNYTQNSNFNVASISGTVKGIKTASRLMPIAFYDMNPDKDRVQWSQNDRMPHDCVKLERYVKNFGNANQRKGKDLWNVAIHWRFFRCCRRGYHVLFGPRPMIYR